MSLRRYSWTVKRRCISIQVSLGLRYPDNRLRHGLSISSYGTNCAAFSGIPPEVIARAELYARLQSQGTELSEMIRGDRSEEEVRDLRRAEAIAKNFVHWNINVSESGCVREELVRMLT